MQGETAEKLDDFIDEEEQRRFDEHMVKVLKRAEEQIKNGQYADADIVFARIRKKYNL